MPIRGVPGIVGLIAVYLCCAQVSWAQSASDRPGPPDGRYTLFVALHPPYEANRAQLQKMLKEEEYESFTEGATEITLVLTKEQIGKLFQARVQFRRTGASATDRIVTEPFLEGVRIPERFGKLIRSVYFDPQRG